MPDPSHPEEISVDLSVLHRKVVLSSLEKKMQFYMAQKMEQDTTLASAPPDFLIGLLQRQFAGYSLSPEEVQKTLYRIRLHDAQTFVAGLFIIDDPKGEPYRRAFAPDGTVRRGCEKEALELIFGEKAQGKIAEMLKGSMTAAI